MNGTTHNIWQLPIFLQNTPSQLPYPLTLPAVRPATKNFWPKIKNEQDRQQAEHGEGNYISPLGKLMLTEETGYGNGKRPIHIVINYRICKGNSSQAVRKLKMETDAMPGLIPASF